jgi:TPR repeat protein
MITLYGLKGLEWDEEKFNKSLVLANQDKPTTSFDEKIEWMKAIRYVAREYWYHFNDEEKTFYYFKRLYDQGAYIDDYVYYGLCYFYGYGVEEDIRKALDIIEKAYNALSDYREKSWAYQMYQMVWYYAHYYEIKQELTQTKETLEARLEQTKNGWIEYIEKYQSKCKEYSTLEAQLSQTKKEWSDKYNQLVKEYNQLVKEYNTLLDNSKQTSQSTNSDLVKVKISYGCVNDLTGWQTNSWQRIEMPRAEYKALLNGSMKAREAYVKNKWLSSLQHAVNVTIALDE